MSKPKWERPARKKMRVTVDRPNGTDLLRGDVVYIARSDTDRGVHWYAVSAKPTSEPNWGVNEEFLEEFPTHEPLMDLEANCKPPRS